VSSRSYLSIGDVLTLLREEFPDVTISKIRFLESQGLVNPERSPSGYRKFFEVDVERLRWVLRQQREHFLPLKVIRDRLSEGDLGEDAPAHAAGPAAAVGAPERNGKLGEPAHVGAASGSGHSRVGAGAGAVGSGGANGPAGVGRAPGGRTEEQMAKADDEAMARILADASRRAALIPEGGLDRTALRVVTDADEKAPPVPGGRHVSRTDAGAPVAARPAGAERPPGGASAGTVGATGTGRSESGPANPAAASAATLTAGTGAAAATPAMRPEPTAPALPRTAAATEAAGSGRAAGKDRAAGTSRDAPSAGAPGRAAHAAMDATAPGPASATTTSMVTGASLTAEELCAASGLSEIELAGLQGFGLIEAEVVAGILTFNEEALTVANLAAEFRKYGIEPRHLRLYRNAVDREIGLIEQVIIPLLRQRNPESRQRAVESAAELGALGQTMRATLLRSALRRHLGG
jgi:DNA-binding transcriptional MerR regulator